MAGRQFRQGQYFGKGSQEAEVMDEEGGGLWVGREVVSSPGDSRWSRLQAVILAQGL